MTTNTTTAPMTPKVKSRRDALRDFLAGTTMPAEQIEAALAILVPKPREMDPNKPIPAGLLVASATVLAESWLAAKAGETIESMLTQRQAALSGRLAHGGADKEAARTTDILARLEAAMRDETKRVTVDKKGNKRPSPAWRAYVHLKAMLADG